MKFAFTVRQVALACILLPLIALADPAAPSGKSVVAIGAITSSVPGSDPVSFQTMIETQMIKANKFKIIERSRLAEILQEKGLSMVGVTNGDAKIAGVSGVDYLIYGSITKLGKDAQRTQVAGFALGSSKVIMAMDLRVVNASTGEMLYAETVQEQTDGGSGTSIPGVRGFGGFHTSQSQADPLADVERLTAKAVTDRIVTAIYPIKVIAVQKDGTVVVNYGDSVLSVGDQLKIFELGESFKDPDTGQVLGAEEKQVGVLKVVDVQSKFSKALVVEGTPQKGNICRRVKPGAAAVATTDHPNGAALP
jgi:curli biogenesis system outer membrane secretion channel CsgG